MNAKALIPTTAKSRSGRLAMLCAAFCLCAAGCGATKSDADLVQGTWTVVAGSDNGKSFPAVEEKQGKVVVNGDQFTMYDPDEPQPKTWTLRLDPATSPKQIDFTMGDKQAPGIYQLDGDHWKLAMILPGHQRPADFKPAESTLILDMQRAAGR